VGFVIGFTIAASALLVLAAAMLNPLSLALSPAALAIVFFYSFTKRFTAWSHAFLGLALSIAPIGAWVAVRGDITSTPLLLGAAVVCWLIGFDVIYALQDVEFDRSAGLHSLPVRFGPTRSLWIGRFFHALMIVCLALTGIAGHRGPLYFAGVALAALLIAFEHAIIKPNDLRRLNLPPAFYDRRRPLFKWPASHALVLGYRGGTRVRRHGGGGGAVAPGDPDRNRGGGCRSCLLVRIVANARPGLRARFGGGCRGAGALGPAAIARSHPGNTHGGA
jgi:hypothetical protein